MNANMDGRMFVRRGWLAAITAAVALLTLGCVNPHRGVPATGHLANFGRVNGSLYRGAQPDEAGLAQLQKLGVATVINLRMANDVRPDEGDSVRIHGMVYWQVPLHGFRAPTHAEVEQVLALIESSPTPVFIHCEHGADRTGTIVACYRIRHDLWPPARALAEAKQYGLSDWEIGMKRFVTNFSSQPASAATPGK
jgi:protein tyrosine phosphatase (PTP) superfamily phosphohydrolase (DUF442 family)